MVSGIISIWYECDTFVTTDEQLLIQYYWLETFTYIRIHSSVLQFYGFCQMRVMYLLLQYHPE